MPCCARCKPLGPGGVRFDGFGAPADGDPNEGWIADPTLSGYTAPTHLIEEQAARATST